MTAAMITADHFPTPDLAIRSDDPAEMDRVSQFAVAQAEMAEALRVRLAAAWPTATRPERLTALRGAHAETVAWRHHLALQAPGRLGQGIPLDASRFVTTLRDGGANCDRLGYLGRLRVGSTWDPASRLYVGGESTPAHDVMLAYGQAALDRFAAEAPDKDTLQNRVRVGTRMLPGNRLVRGEAAQGIADLLVKRIASRGGDTSKVETGGDPVYVVTADPDDADLLFKLALSALADAHLLPHGERVRAWQDARYLMYQAPRMKKGSDAVTRVFLVAVGAVLFDQAPMMVQDIDLRCMVLGQRTATDIPVFPI